VQIFGAEILGIQGILIQFGAVVEPGSGASLLGVPSTVVKEGYTRAIKAIELVDGDWNLANCKVTIQMRPSDLIKRSEGLDLPIAITLLKASICQDPDKLEDLIARLSVKAESINNNHEREDSRKRILYQIEQLINQKKRIQKYKQRFNDDDAKYLIIGGVDITTGNIEPPRHGLLSMLDAADPSFKVIVPEQSNAHAALVMKAKGFKAYFASSLNEVWQIIIGEISPREVKYPKSKISAKPPLRYIEDFNEIDGVAKAKEAMTVAVAGGHNILLIGPPGEGKGMLSRAAIRLLPPLNPNEVFEVNKIYSAFGDLNANEIIVNRPFREVHSQIRNAALFGGGVPPVPGEISLAHKGILLFDEINLFDRDTIELLRTPLEEKRIIIQRVNSLLKPLPLAVVPKRFHRL
jgi:predicted ATPase with chaperone activity